MGTMAGPQVPIGAYRRPLYAYPGLPGDGLAPGVWCCGEGWVSEFNTIAAVYPTPVNSPLPLPFFPGQICGPSPGLPPPPAFPSFCHSPAPPFSLPWWPPPAAFSAEHSASNAAYGPADRSWTPESPIHRRASRRTKSDVSRGGWRPKPEALAPGAPNEHVHHRRNSWGGEPCSRGTGARNGKNGRQKGHGGQFQAAEGPPAVPRWQRALVAQKQLKSAAKQTSVSEPAFAEQDRLPRSPWSVQKADTLPVNSSRTAISTVKLASQEPSSNDEKQTPGTDISNKARWTGQSLSQYKPGVDRGLDVRPLRSSCTRKKAGPSTSLPHCLRTVLASTQAGLDAGHAPELTISGTGGTYVMNTEKGIPVAVFKPEDEEPCTLNNPRGLGVKPSGEGLKKGVKPGEGAVREVAAYLLDHDHFAGVPPTMLVCCRSKNKLAANRGDSTQGSDRICKVGSLQRFVVSDADCEEMGPSAFSEDEVHKICVLDMRLANADRNGSNILAHRQEEGGWELTPIDHSYCLPDTFEDICFEWKYWRQAKVPFSEGILRHIASLDAKQDLKVLEAHGINLSDGSRQVFRACTSLLKKGAACGLTPYEISDIMCREAFEPSPLETLFKMAVATCKTQSVDTGSTAACDICVEDCLMAAVDEQIDRYLANDSMKINKNFSVQQ